MQQQPLPFPTHPAVDQWEHLFYYFVEAEEKQSVVTSVSIQKTWPTESGETRDLDSVRWYMYRYWRWFLFCIDDKVRPFQYKVQNIRTYPKEYFIQAHADPKRMQYLVHFVRSIEQDKALRKLASGTGQPRKPRQDGASGQEMLPGLERDGDDASPDELDVPIDMHRQEEGPIQEMSDTPLSPDQVRVESAEVVLGEHEASTDQLEGESLPGMKDAEQVPDQNESELLSKGKETPSPRRLAVGVVIGTGVVVVAVVAYFLLFRRS